MLLYLLVLNNMYIGFLPNLGQERDSYTRLSAHSKCAAHSKHTCWRGGVRLLCLFKVSQDPGWDINKDTEWRRDGLNLYSRWWLNNYDDECIINDSSRMKLTEAFQELPLQIYIRIGVTTTTSAATHLVYLTGKTRGEHVRHQCVTVSR